MLLRESGLLLVALLKFRSNLSQLYIFRPLQFSYATFSNIFLITGARSVSTITYPFLSILFSFRYPVGAGAGQSPISHLILRPRLTFTLLLSLSNLAWLHRIIKRNFSLGLFVNL